jgi:hypothetical protein
MYLPNHKLELYEKLHAVDQLQVAQPFLVSSGVSSLLELLVDKQESKVKDLKTKINELSKLIPTNHKSTPVGSTSIQEEIEMLSSQTLRIMAEISFICKHLGRYRPCPKKPWFKNP